MIHLTPGMVVSVPASRSEPAHTVRLLTSEEYEAILQRCREVIAAAATPPERTP